MRYIVKTMGGEKIFITEAEYKTILATPNGFIAFPSCGVTINTSRIESVYPESLADEITERKEQKTGVLHDGTRVRRYFGEWVDADSFVPDDKGNYQPVRLDPNYYPEVARDCVPTEKEFEEMRMLAPANRLIKILDGTAEPRLSSGGMNAIKELL